MNQIEFSLDDLFVEEFEEISHIDSRKLAINCILSFFKNREYKSGGFIPRGELLREENISKIFKYVPSDEKVATFIDGLDMIHEILCQNDSPKGFEDKKSIAWEIDFLNKLQLDSALAGVPKCFSIGITLLNLQYCYGMSKWSIWN